MAAESSSVSYDEAEEDREGKGRVQPSSRLVPVQVQAQGPTAGGRLPLTVSSHQLLAGGVPAATASQTGSGILSAGPHVVRFYKTSPRDLSKSSSAIEETVLRLKVVCDGCCNGVAFFVPFERNWMRIKNSDSRK